MQATINNGVSEPAPVVPGAILVAAGLSEIPRLLPHVVAEARSAHTHVALLHSILPSGAEAPEANPPSTAWFKMFRDARVILLGAARQIESHGVACSTCVREGDAGEVIRAELARIQASKLIIARPARAEAAEIGDLTAGVDVPVIAVEV